MAVSIYTLKLGVILFWAIWLVVVCLSNLIDVLKSLGVLPDSWRLLASKNYAAMRDVLGESVPPIVTRLLLIAVTLWEVFMAYLMWRALFDFTLIPAAFGASLALWALFMIVDEAYAAYELEATHLRLFTSMLVTVIFLLIVPT